MKKTYDKEEIIQLKKSAIRKLNTLMEECIHKEDAKKNKKAVLLAKWINNYVDYLRFEDRFQANKNIAYKRGNIVKANFGFRVGAELGGVHYAVVLDKNNIHNADTVTVVPLSSIKSENKIHERDLRIGNEFYNLIVARVNALTVSLEKELRDVIDVNNIIGRAIESLAKIDDKEKQEEELGSIDALHETNAEKIEEMKKQLDLLKRMKNELSFMREGSIVKIEQITTISKMRIIDPKHTGNVLSNVSLSENTMKKINEKIKEIYIFDE